MSIKPTSGRKKVSIIWCYFDYDAVGDKSKCKICDKSLKGENTTNMISHLKQHPEAYVKFENEEKQKKRIVIINNSECSYSVHCRHCRSISNKTCTS